MRIALVARELYPYATGGIAPIVAAEARRLRAIAEVTVVTSGSYRGQHEELRGNGDPRLLPDDIELVFVDEPGDAGHGERTSYMHVYSARVHATLRELYGDSGPDLIEFCDYLAEGFVTIQARRTRAPWLERTLVCVRLHTTSEFCSVLDASLPEDFETIAVHDAERYCLEHADRLLWSGGDVLETYRRYYGADRLAPGVKIPDGFFSYDATDPGREGGPAPGDPVRFLYLGRVERRKGVQNLLRAVTALDRDDWRLTLLGGDTLTGPLQSSLRSQLELMAGGDPRIDFADPVPRSEVGAFVRSHDVVVIPSLWECWPNTAREALMYNRPVLATPVGGLTEMAVPGRSGWLARDSSPTAIAEALNARLDDPESVVDLIAAGGPRAVYEEITDAEAFVERYRTLCAKPLTRSTPSARDSLPLVSIIVPYFELDAYVGETLESIAAQTYASIETIVVNDGSFRDEDRVIDEVAARPRVKVVTQVNSGLGAARNFGALHARGLYVLPLDADDYIDPTFVARCVDVLEREPLLSYVTTWVQYMDHDGVDFGDEDGGYMPYGNWSRLITQNNVAGVCTSLMRREIFDNGLRYSHDLTSYEDWFLFWEMREAGYLGGVIPERLFRYRVRETSMMRAIGAPHVGVIHNEMRAHLRERATSWTARSPAGEPAGADLPRARPQSSGDAVAVDAERLAELERANSRLTRTAFATFDPAAAARMHLLELRALEAEERAAELERRLASEERARGADAAPLRGRRGWVPNRLHRGR